MKKILLGVFICSSLNAYILDKIEDKIRNNSLVKNHRVKLDIVIGTVVGSLITKLAAPKINSLYNKVYNWFKK